MTAKVEGLTVVTGESMLRQGARTQWLLSARVMDGKVEVGHAAAWVERNPQAGRTIQWEVDVVVHGVVSGSFATRAEAHQAVIAAARTMAALTLLRSEANLSIPQASTPASEQAPAEVATGGLPMTVDKQTIAAGTMVENQTVPATLTGIVVGPSEGLPGFVDVRWSDGRTEAEQVEDVTIIAPETNDRGQTYEQAIEAFKADGVEVQPEDVPALVRAGVDVWTFGYGDGWMDPDGYTTIETSDLWAFEGSEADAEVVASWAPFTAEKASL